MAHKPAPPLPALKPIAPPHPQMMGDGTEEQNLNQPGNPAARITQDEVKDAFAKPNPKHDAKR